MNSLKELRKLVEPVGGVKPSFDLCHVYLALISLLHEAPMGRVSLARRLAIGGSSVKTLIKRMRESNLIDVDRVAGALLTTKGLELAKQLSSTIKPVGPLELGAICDNCVGYALVVKGFRGFLESIGYLRLRDQVVREGAEGAIVIYCGETPLMPVSGGFEEVRGILREVASASCGEGDVLTISICYGGSDRVGTCEKALLNAILRLLDP